MHYRTSARATPESRPWPDFRLTYSSFPRKLINQKGFISGIESHVVRSVASSQTLVIDSGKLGPKSRRKPRPLHEKNASSEHNSSSSDKLTEEAWLFTYGIINHIFMRLWKRRAVSITQFCRVSIDFITLVRWPWIEKSYLNVFRRRMQLY